MALTKVSYSMITGAPINVLDFGAVGDGVTNDSAAFQAAMNLGSSAGVRGVYVPQGTYLVKDVTIPTSMYVFGDGINSSVIKSIATTYNGYKYSSNIFTNTAGISDLIFSDLTFDGAGTSAPYDDAYPNEIPLVLTQDVTRTQFSNIKITHYTAQTGPNAASETIFQRQFQAITVRNLNSSEYVKFENVSFIDNYFEICDIYNGPNSNCIVTVSNCVEYNTDTVPDGQTCFQFSGGHIVLKDSYFYNVGAASIVNLNVTKTSIISNNNFIKQIGGSSAVGPAINYGQESLYGQDNCIITGNYFENVGAGCVIHSGGSNILITDNICVDGGLKAFDIRCDLNTASFSSLYPGFPVPTLGPNYTLHIINNVINGTEYTSGPTGQGITIGYVTPSATNLWNDVIVQNNFVSYDTAPLDTRYCVVFNAVNDIEISGNYFTYRSTAIYSEDYAKNVKIENNTFGGLIATQSHDILFAGSIANKNLIVKNNTFIAMPLAGAYNVNVVSTLSFSEIIVKDNIGMKPKYEIYTTSSYLLEYTYGKRLSSVPTTGIWNIYTNISATPVSGQRMGWITSGNGCFATFTATASGTSGNYFVTVTDGTQFSIGQYIQIAGMGAAGASIFFVVCSVDGNILNTDGVVLTTASAQAITAINPTFIAMANYA